MLPHVAGDPEPAAPSLPQIELQPESGQEV